MMIVITYDSIQLILKMLKGVLLKATWSATEGNANSCRHPVPVGTDTLRHARIAALIHDYGEPGQLQGAP